MLHICLVTFISFISYTKVHLIHFVFYFHLNHFIDHSSSHSHFTIFGYTRITSYFNLIVSFIFEPIPSLETRSVSRQSFNLKYILYHLKLNSNGITTLCYFTRITTPNLFTPKKMPVNF